MTRIKFISAWVRLFDVIDSSLPSKRRWRRMALNVVAIILGSMAVTFVGALVTLQTSWGRAAVIDLAEGTVDGLRIGAVGSGLPLRVQLTDVEYRDGATVIATVDTAILEWSPLALLGGTVHLTKIDIDRPVLHQLPHATATSLDTNEPVSGGILSLPFGVRVDHIRIENAAVLEPVMGERLDLRLQSDMRADVSGLLALNFSAERLGPIPTTLSGAISYDLTQENLIVDIQGTEPQGGALSALLGLVDRPAGFLTLIGEGPIKDWRGNLTAGFDGVLNLTQTLNLLIDERYVLTADGTVNVDGLLPPELATLRGDDLAVALSFSADDEINDVQAIVDVSNTAFAFNAAFESPDITEHITLKAKIDVLQSTAFSNIVPDTQPENLTISMVADGPIDSVPVTLTAQAKQVSLPDLTIQNPTMTATITPASPWAEGGGLIDATASVSVRRADGDALGAAAPLIAKPVQIDGQTTVQIFDDLVTLSDLTLTLPWMMVSGETVIDTTSGGVSGTLHTKVPSLAFTQPITGSAMDGHMGVRADFDIEGGLGTIKTSVTLDALSTGDAAMDALTKDGITASAQIVLSGDGAYQIKDAKAEMGALRLNADVTIAEALSGRYSLRLTDLSMLSTLAGADLSGQVAMNGSLGGPVTDPATAIALEGWNLQADALRMPRLSATADARTLITKPRGSLKMTAEGPSGPASLSLMYVVEGGDRLALQNLLAQAAGLKATGAISTTLSTLLATGRLDLQAPDLAPTGALLGIALSGAANGEITLSDTKGHQNARFTVQTSNVVADDVRLKTAAIQGSVILVNEGVAVDATARLENLTAAGLSIEKADVVAKGPAEAIAVNLTASGAMAAPFTLSTSALIGQNADGLVADISVLQAILAGTPVTLRRPARLSSTNAGQTVLVDMAIGSGQMALDATLRPDAVRATLSGQAIPLGLIGVALADTALSGDIDVNADLDFSPASDAGTIQLTIRQISVDRGGGRTMPPVDVALKAVIAAGLADINATIKGPIDTPATAFLKLPLERVAGSPVPQLAMMQPIKGDLDWTGDLSEIEPLIPVSGHRLAGPAKIDFQIDGTLDAPKIKGNAVVTGGAYENLLFGTLLTNVQATITGTAGGDLTLQMAAQDGRAGTISMSGAVAMAAEPGPRVDIKTALNGFRVVRRDEVDAVLSGDVSIAMAGATGSIIGALILDPVEIRLLDTLPASVTRLDVQEEIDGDAENVSEKQPDPVILDLDVSVTVPRRTYVRGRGVDSEWQGAITVTGTTDKPLIKGGINIVRGQVSALGKVFKIEKGTVDLDGAADPDPILDIVATTTAESLTITMAVTGRSTEPSIAFSSAPPLPQDEIMAQMLFGKRAGELGPAEALALADSIQTLRSGDGGTIDKIRKATGLDVLRASSGENGPSVTAGKYIADGVFVGVNQGVAPGESSATVEVDITDQLSVESEMGANSDSKVGVNWKIDY